ncbi:hypothetical protein [Streptomyces albospinus]|uniref:hypothetical protein n=1 Tax=Streptomyces albospinus TaxID=285515 RepID=UPI001E5AA3D2|nr:hypothetical protein [Streptomyces albospinus]
MTSSNAILYDSTATRTPATTRRDASASTWPRGGGADRVEAVRTEAHALLFEPECFDAIVGIDAFE